MAYICMAPLSWRVAGETSLILGSCGLPPWLPLIAPYDAFTTPFGITFWGILADRRCLVISFGGFASKGRPAACPRSNGRF